MKLKHVAFDLHGTIDKNPSFFKKLSNEIYLLDKDFKIFILSGSKEDTIRRELNDLNFEEKYYTDILSINDYLDSIGVIKTYIESRNEITYDEDLWWATKRILCTKFNIGFLIDNDIRYSIYFRNIINLPIVRANIAYKKECPIFYLYSNFENDYDAKFIANFLNF